MTLPFPRHLLFLASFLFLTVTGCSQPASYSDHDGFIMSYPRQGDDIGPIVEAVLNRWGDPRLSNEKFDGVIKFKVLSARVLVAESLIPRPDGTFVKLPFHAHTIMTLPNGQTLETDHCDAIYGNWYQGHVRQVYLGQWSPGLAGFGTWPLDDLDPAVVGQTRNAIHSAHDQVALQYAINDPCSLEDLLWHLRGHDIANAKYDFTFWKQANEIAMRYADAAFGPPGGPTPWENNGGPAGTAIPEQMNPAAQSAPVPPVIDSVSISITDAIRFEIPIHDRRWSKYKAVLPQFKFDSGEWSAVYQQGLSHEQLEKHLYEVLNERYELGQAVFRKQCQPVINELAQATYVAQQHDATPQQKDAYAILRAKDDPILDQSSGPLIATHILLDSIHDDLKNRSDNGR
jgi:hypothetical protein